MKTISDHIEALRDTIAYIEGQQAKARSAGAYTRLQDKAIAVLEVVEFLERQRDDEAKRAEEHDRIMGFLMR